MAAQVAVMSGTFPEGERIRRGRKKNSESFAVDPAIAMVGTVVNLAGGLIVD